MKIKLDKITFKNIKRAVRNKTNYKTTVFLRLRRSDCIFIV